MKFHQFKNKKIYEEAVRFAAIGNRGVQLALKESLKKGIPSVFGIVNKIFYRMPDGTITSKSPFGKSAGKE
jgi:hypothetical protein